MSKKPNISLESIDSIKPYKKNAKIHDDKQVEKIAASIKEFGWTQPIVVDKDGYIIAGHGRRLAAIKLGMKQVPVLRRDDLTDEQVRALRLADNRVAISDLDSNLLQEELSDLNFDLSAFFDKKELDFLEADLGEYNADAFVDDIEVEVQKQSEESNAKVKEVDNKRVKIEKALGFKDITVAEERLVARFMAEIEAETEKEGADAFIAFVSQLLEDQS